MPKRSKSEKIEFYSAKIRKLQEPRRKKRLRTIIYSDSSDSENNSDIAPINNVTTPTAGPDHTPSEELLDISPPQPEGPILEEPPIEVPLDSDVLSALGDAAEEAPVYGEPIHPDLAQRWLPILRKGLSKDEKDKLLKEYTFPDNCKLLRAPTLNAEISSAVNEKPRNRDQKIAFNQNQLGLGITAVNRALSMLLANDDRPNKVRAIKILSDGCRILSDLHCMETKARIKLITPGIDKSFLSFTQDLERDETLFGSKLAERIKSSKIIEKQGLQIKKPTPTAKSFSTSFSATSNRPRYQGNWSGPPRFPPSASRGGRAATQRYNPYNPAARRAPPPPPAAPGPARATNYLKQRDRAPTRQ
ncbi:unnamed protein product [Plutella xylostella]|uniref:(diamondback moth) hypothetical protein n=1 Tax=Plutella xylostella TaxID=51655 RepID=A0A8S4EMZ3_PLUXY|nr:unnamed protein product [Plutella xylostella]